MFCVEDILKKEYHEFEILKLVAGKEGLHREISWPNTILTLPISEWLKPGEMVIISGIGMEVQEKELLEMVEQAADGGASCLVIMLSEQHIPSIPESVIEHADRRNIPLFTAPWDMQLGFIMSRVSSIIEKQRLKDEVLSQLLFELLSQDADAESCMERAKLYGYDLEKPHRIVMFKIDNMKEVLEQKKFESEAQNYEYKNRIRRDIEHNFYAEHIKCFGGVRKSSFVIVCEVDDMTREQVRNFLEQVIKRMELLHPELKIRIGFSSKCAKVENYVRGIREARTAVQFQTRKDRVSSFEETGILPWLISGADPVALKIMYEESVGKLLLADERDGNGLLETLEIYLKNNGNAVQTAQKLYIHRNTLLKRLEKIEELLDVSLEDAYTRNDLFNILIVGKYL